MASFALCFAFLVLAAVVCCVVMFLSFFFLLLRSGWFVPPFALCFCKLVILSLRCAFLCASFHVFLLLFFALFGCFFFAFVCVFSLSFCSFVASPGVSGGRLVGFRASLALCVCCVRVLFVMVSAFFSGFSSFGFGGSRSPSATCLSAARSVLCVLRACVVGSSVFSSCGSGVPALAAAAFPGLQLFSATGFAGLGRAAFAARAAVLVRSLAAAPSPLWICFPGCACPPACRPSRSWSVCGSGSWSECALACGLGVPVLVFLPCGVAPPPAWGFAPVAGAPGWWFAASPPPVPSLF